MSHFLIAPRPHPTYSNENGKSIDVDIEVGSLQTSNRFSIELAHAPGFVIGISSFFDREKLEPIFASYLSLSAHTKE